MLPRVQIVRSITASARSLSFSNHPLTLRRLISTTTSLKMPSEHVFNNKDGATYTTSNGAPIEVPYAQQRAGQIGPLLLQGAL